MMKAYRKSRNSMLLVMILAIGLFASSAAPAVLVVVPNDLENTAGGSGNCFPFAPTSSYSIPRYQQVYGAADLTSLIGLEIVGISFRVDDWHNEDIAGGFVYENIQIRLSTTTRSVDGLSTDLNSNVGTDETVVFDGQYVLPNLEGDQPINSFDMTFSFSTPFSYTGRNLLMDIFMPLETPSAFYLDAAYRSGDAVSRAYLLNGSPYTSTTGLVTRFEAIPEPGTILLVGLGGLALTRRRRQ